MSSFPAHPSSRPWPSPARASSSQAPSAASRLRCGEAPASPKQTRAGCDSSRMRLSWLLRLAAPSQTRTIPHRGCQGTGGLRIDPTPPWHPHHRGLVPQPRTRKSPPPTSTHRSRIAIRSSPAACACDQDHQIPDSRPLRNRLSEPCRHRSIILPAEPHRSSPASATPSPDPSSFAIRPSSSPTPPDTGLLQTPSSDTPCCPPRVPADSENLQPLAHAQARAESHTSAASPALSWPVD